MIQKCDGNVGVSRMVCGRAIGWWEGVPKMEGRCACGVHWIREKEDFKLFPFPREQKKSSYSDKKSKRWVVYKGLAEPSKVPSSWHGWLHYTIDEPLQYEHAWQKPHTPNLTVTPNAYSPTDNEGKRKKTSCDYEAWSPNIEYKWVRKIFLTFTCIFISIYYLYIKL